MKVLTLALSQLDQKFWGWTSVLMSSQVLQGILTLALFEDH